MATIAIAASFKETKLQTKPSHDPIARIARVELSKLSDLAPLKMSKSRPTPERLVAHAEGNGESRRTVR